MDETKYKTFVEWYATPIAKRKETSLALWCEKHNMAPADTIPFYEHPTFFVDVHEAAIKWGMSQVSDYLAMLDEKIRAKKSTKDILAFIEILEKLRKKGVTNQNLVFNIPEDRVEEIIKRNGHQ